MQIERALFRKELKATDVPSVWNTTFKEMFGVEVPDDRRGCLQDVHWSRGAFGYFPSYTLGAIYAAQLFAAMRAALGDLDALVADGDFAPIFGWLATQVWSQGCRFETPELLRHATGSALDAGPYRAHLTVRYGGLTADATPSR